MAGVGVTNSRSAAHFRLGNSLGVRPCPDFLGRERRRGLSKLNVYGFGRIPVAAVPAERGRARASHFFRDIREEFPLRARDCGRGSFRIKGQLAQLPLMVPQGTRRLRR